METVDIDVASVRVSHLLEGVAQGQSFAIAKAEKPIAKVVPFSSSKRLGFLAGQLRVPDDFDRMREKEIEARA